VRVVKFLEEQFTEDWAEDDELSDIWVVATASEITAFSRVTAIISQQEVAPFPAAPNSHRTVTVTLELVSPLADVDAGAEQIEDLLPTVLDYLDPRYPQGTATAFLYGKQFAYRISFPVFAQKVS
jgi:hypothetical protein